MKRKIITEADILERMRECWEKLSFDRKLSKREEDVIDTNFNLIQLYVSLKRGGEEHSFACGFEYEDAEDEEENEDEEE